MLLQHDKIPLNKVLGNCHSSLFFFFCLFGFSFYHLQNRIKVSLFIFLIKNTPILFHNDAKVPLWLLQNVSMQMHVQLLICLLLTCCCEGKLPIIINNLHLPFFQSLHPTNKLFMSQFYSLVTSPKKWGHLQDNECLHEYWNDPYSNMDTGQSTWRSRLQQP